MRKAGSPTRLTRHVTLLRLMFHNSLEPNSEHTMVAGFAKSNQMVDYPTISAGARDDGMTARGYELGSPRTWAAREIGCAVVARIPEAVEGCCCRQDRDSENEIGLLWKAGVRTDFGDIPVGGCG